MERIIKTVLAVTLIFLCLFPVGCTQETKEKTSKSGKNQIASQDTKENTVESEEKQEVLPGPDTSQREKAGTPGFKTITITINGLNGSQETQVIETEAGDLLTAVESTGIAQSSPEDYGYILTVGGYTANLSNGEWWQISKNGAYLMNSADQTAIEDGDVIIFDLQKLN